MQIKINETRTIDSNDIARVVSRPVGKAGKTELTAVFADGTRELIRKAGAPKPVVQLYTGGVNGNAAYGTLGACFTFGKTINRELGGHARTIAVVDADLVEACDELAEVLTEEKPVESTLVHPLKSTNGLLSLGGVTHTWNDAEGNIQGVLLIADYPTGRFLDAWDSFSADGMLPYEVYRELRAQGVDGDWFRKNHQVEAAA